MKIKIHSEDQLASVAKEMLSVIQLQKVILFYGAMGAGKTTLIKAICQELDVEENMSSPTFSIVNEYLSSQEGLVYHFDFYRIENEEEAMDFGYEDYFYSGNYCFIEWPERIPNLLPQDHVKVKIELTKDNNRIITVV